MFLVVQVFELAYGSNSHHKAAFLVQADSEDKAISLVKNNHESENPECYEYEASPFAGVSFDDPSVQVKRVWDVYNS